MEDKKIVEWLDKLVEGDFMEKLHEIVSDLSEEDNVLFTHCLINIFPLYILKQVSDKEFKDLLEFNHFANRVAIKFSK